MKPNNKPKGNFGESVASNYLAKKGFYIITRNFHSRVGEIDIIATHKNTLVFIEVKTRSSEEFGSSLEAVTPWKIKAISTTAQYFKLLHPNLPESMQIDVVTVQIDQSGKVTEIKHLSNVTG